MAERLTKEKERVEEKENKETGGRNDQGERERESTEKERGIREGRKNNQSDA